MAMGTLETQALRSQVGSAGVAGATREMSDAVVGGRFKIERPLASGGMGSIFLGTQLDLERPVAIKVVSSQTPDYLERFRREAMSLASVNHPAIVEIYDFLKDDEPGGDQCYLVMAFIDGQDLLDYLETRGGKLDPDEAVELCLPVASALVELHQRGIVHRDVKPANIVRFMRADGRAGVKLVDFGIARRSDDPTLTQDGLIVGTPPYLSPEVLTGKKHAAVADVYALGATIWELCTGLPPFGKENLHEIMTRTLTETPVLPSMLDGTPLGGLLLRMLEKDDEKRIDARTAVAELSAIPRGPAVSSTMAATGLPAHPPRVDRDVATLAAVPPPVAPAPAPDSGVKRALFFGSLGLNGVLAILAIILAVSGGDGKKGGGGGAPDGEKPGVKAAMDPGGGDSGMSTKVAMSAAMEGMTAKAGKGTDDAKLPPIHKIARGCKSKQDAQRLYDAAKKGIGKDNPKQVIELARRRFHALLSSKCAQSYHRRWSAKFLYHHYVRRHACKAAYQLWATYRSFTRAATGQSPAFPGCR